MLTDSYGRLINRAQFDHARLVTLAADETYSQGVQVCSSASGTFSVTTVGGETVAIVWDGYKPLPVTVTTIFKTGTTATGIVAYW